MNNSIISFFFHTTSTFQLLDKPWSQVPSLLPPRSRLQFLSRIGPRNPTDRLIVDPPSSVVNSRSRAFRKSFCAQQGRVPTIFYEYMLSRGLELTNLTYTRLENKPETPPGRPVYMHSMHERKQTTPPSLRKYSTPLAQIK